MQGCAERGVEGCGGEEAYVEGVVLLEQVSWWGLEKRVRRGEYIFADYAQAGY